jgi:serine-type D-Ala-D-Ala carboxypeptidase/endopeptidase
MYILKILFAILLVLIAVFGIHCCLAWKRNNSMKNTKNLQALIDQRITEAIAQQHARGLVIGIVKGNQVVIKGYGIIRDGSAEKPDSNTLFELGSICKIFTSSALQMGVHRKTFDFKDPISKYLAPRVSVPNAFDVTLLNLATHTSGFPRLPKMWSDKLSNMQNPYKDLTYNDLYDYLKTCSENEPAGTFAYSNLGMGLLGHILELEYDKKYEDIIKEEICSKLGMNQTTITLSELQKKQVSQGYDSDGKPTSIWDFPVLTGAGGFLSNATDMIQFIKANLDENYSAISPQLITCHTPQLNGDTGLGWHLFNGWVAKMNALEGIRWHNGGTGGYRTYIGIDKKNKNGLIILSNSTNNVTNLGMRLMLFIKKVSFED